MLTNRKTIGEKMNKYYGTAKDGNQITKEQDQKIKTYLPKTWDHIYLKILTPEQRKLMKDDKQYQKSICFQMEEYYKGLSNEFGLSALLDDEDENNENE
jgi:Spy/CpxP family protein refolding chaperone